MLKNDLAFEPQISSPFIGFSIEIKENLKREFLIVGLLKFIILFSGAL